MTADAEEKPKSAAYLAMKAQFDAADERGKKILIARALVAKKNHVERAKHAGPGGLLHFVRYFWNILEPMTPLVEGWPLAALCDHLEAVSRGQITRLLINVPPGFMKPVHVDEPILTRRGFVRLGDVAVGDQVLTHNGRFRKVLAVHEQGEIPIVRVKTWNERSVRAAPDHPFLTTRGWVPAGALTDIDYVAVPYIHELPDDGDKVTSDEARLLGYLIGDGCISQRSLSFVNADQEVIDDFIKCATSCGFYAYVVVHPNKNVQARKVVLKSSEERMRSKQWSGEELPVLAWLKKHNLYRCDSYTKRIPAAVLRSGQEAIASFVGAYWSCDGTIVFRHKGNKTTMMASATTVSEGLAGDMQRALMLLNIKARIRPKVMTRESIKQPGGLYRSFDIQTAERNEVAKIAKLPALCSRKRKLAENAFFDRFEGGLFEDAVVGVEDAGKGFCRCLTVEEDESFTVNGLVVHNSLLSNVFLPAWHWSAYDHPHSRFLAFSYAASLTERDNRKLLSLFTSDQFQQLYGNKFKLGKAGESLITNDKTGFKFASSVGGVSTGERADILTCDDPHAVRDSESETVRNNTVTWFKESMQNRLNNPKTSAIIVIMQRVHQGDISGIIRDEYSNYEKLTIPMMYDGRDIVNGQKEKTSIGWSDPRTKDSEIAWPERYDMESLRPFMSQPYLWASQYQQTPEPRGGAIIKREYWKKWDRPNYPSGISYIIASADTAYTEKESNDPSALTIWGLFDIETQPHLFLMYAWRKRLELHGMDTDRKPGENEPDWIARTQHRWGLCEWIGYSCKRFKVHKLIIEGKASGLSVAQELRRLYRGQGWSIETVTPEGDKVARAHAAVSTFTDGLVYAPDKIYSRLVIDETAMFPRGRYKDLTDTVTQAIKHFRDNGLLLRRTEKARYDDEERRTNYNPAPLYPV